MSIVGIGSNITSLIAQRGLTRSSDDLSNSYKRLSSGLRINSASDDAAGLAVSSTLNSQKRLYTTSQRNISDGLSALSIAGSTLSNQNDILTRMAELAEQAANGTFSSTQRTSLQNEYSQLRAEFGRIAATTKFNGLDLLHGSKRGGNDSLNFQVGIDGSRNSSLSVTLGDSGQFSGILDVSQLNTIQSDIDGVQSINVATLEEYYGAGLLKVDDSTYVGLSQYITNGDYALMVYKKDAGSETYSQVSSDYLSYNHSTGAITASSVANALQQGVDVRALTLGDSTGQYAPNFGGATNIDFARIDTQSYARTTLDTVRRRAEEISKLMGNLGASESRLRTAHGINSTLGQEVGAAASRIQDADIAEEAAKLVAAQVRQQAAASVLKSANFEPQLVLKLLRG